MASKELSKTVTSIFEQIKRIDENGNEFWLARDFAKVLEYVKYRNFIPVLNRANYLIVQNADPSKEVIALGQTYFADY